MTPRERLADAPPAVGAIVERMRALRAALPERDGVAVFNDLYLSVTEEVERRLARGGYFADPDATAHLCARFAERFLDAVADASAGRRTRACWRPLILARQHRGVAPVQFALAGINAHVGHDLPLAVVDTCEERDLHPSDIAADYHRVGDLLESLEDRIRDDLMPGPDALDVADPLTHLAGSWSLDRAREGAWSAARVRWRLRELPEMAEEFDQRLDQSIGLVSRCLLVPLDRS
ncbi:DUF5995 family protein [Streptomyces boninensis]|uniref:DUF5995 family protein n=1 Tax=Streptomyces boninensis TaxID=2039455 RepID=UPI003B2264A8